MTAWKDVVLNHDSGSAPADQQQTKPPAPANNQTAEPAAEEEQSANLSTEPVLTLEEEAAVEPSSISQAMLRRMEGLHLRPESLNAATARDLDRRNWVVTGNTTVLDTGHSNAMTEERLERGRRRRRQRIEDDVRRRDIRYGPRLETRRMCDALRAVQNERLYSGDSRHPQSNFGPYSGHHSGEDTEEDDAHVLGLSEAFASGLRGTNGGGRRVVHVYTPQFVFEEEGGEGEGEGEEEGITGDER